MQSRQLAPGECFDTMSSSDIGKPRLMWRNPRVSTENVASEASMADKQPWMQNNGQSKKQNAKAKAQIRYLGRRKKSW
jgi:hypothetical protein